MEVLIIRFYGFLLFCIFLVFLLDTFLKNRCYRVIYFKVCWGYPTTLVLLVVLHVNNFKFGLFPEYE